MTLDSDFWANAQALPQSWDEVAYTSFVNRYRAFVPKKVHMMTKFLNCTDGTDEIVQSAGSYGPDGCLQTEPVVFALKPISWWFSADIFTSDTWPYKLSDSQIANLDNASR